MTSIIETKAVDLKDAESANKEATQALVVAQRFTIKNQKTYEDAGEKLSIVKSRIKVLTEKRIEITRPLDVSKRKIMDFFRQPLDKYETVKRILERSIRMYSLAQEERQRKEQERIDRDIARREKEKRDKLEAQAKAAREKGDREKAARLKEKAADVHIETPIVAPKIQQPDKMYFSEKWYAEVVDKNKIPRIYLEPNMKQLNQFAVATKGQVTIAGVIFKSTRTVVNRGR